MRSPLGVTLVCTSKQIPHGPRIQVYTKVNVHNFVQCACWLIYLLIPQISVCKSVCLYICHSIRLYLAYLANLSHDRLCARPVCCTGPDNVHCPVWRCFDASRLYIIMSFCAVHSLTFTFYRPPFAGCVLVARWRIWHLADNI